jgi:hypothetical protein
VNLQDRGQPLEAAAKLGRGRLILGVMIFVCGFASPALIPFVVRSSLPAGFKAALSGLLAFGIPELMMLLAVAVLGKAGFESIKGILARFLRRYGPPETVSPARYRLGLFLFALPLLFGALEPYMGHHIPGYEGHPRVFHVSGDAMFLLSFFVLGGSFWDKVRALFVRQARAVFPSK